MNKAKIMKHFLIYTAAVLILFTACEQEYETPEGATLGSHHMVYGSSDRNRVQVGDYLTFLDASTGVVERQWDLPGDSVSNIQGGGLNDTLATAQQINVVFNKLGMYEINLFQQFEDSMFYTLKDFHSDTTAYDTVLSVEVIDTVRLINISAKYEGNNLTLESGAKNVIKAGESVEFSIDEVTGAGATPEWTLNGAEPTLLSGLAGTAVYKTIGTYDLYVESTRFNPKGIDSLFIKDFIEVIPSDKPVTIISAYEKDDEIGIEFSRPIKASSVDKNEFEVVIEEEDGTIINPTIEIVKLDSEDPSKMTISLVDEIILDSDEVTVNYVKGNLESEDFYPLESFSTDVEFLFSNLLAPKGPNSTGWSMENTDEWENPKWGNAIKWNTNSSYVYSGSQSAYMDNSAVTSWTQAALPKLTVEAGMKLKISAWIFVKNYDVSTSSFQVYFQAYSAPTQVESVGPNVPVGGTTTTGDWVYYEKEITVADGVVFYWPMVRVLGSGEAYIEDVSISEVVERP
ncbi:hypothetical protein [Reichenbachiella versicolor]|uniref:hypothetical protein n=1 Tax=Reichenbachiella versicolor TaxID=1821036 RepID=UPI0013A55522|nr:hypothetical protein [Reichenbachiella versicolor]